MPWWLFGSVSVRDSLHRMIVVLSTVWSLTSRLSVGHRNQTAVASVVQRVGTAEALRAGTSPLWTPALGARLAAKWTCRWTLGRRRATVTGYGAGYGAGYGPTSGDVTGDCVTPVVVCHRSRCNLRG